MDPFEAFKEKQKQAWASFPPFELVTTQAAPRLVRFARIPPGARVVDALASDAPKLATLRRELDEAITPYFEANVIRQDYLLSRATKRPA